MDRVAVRKTAELDSLRAWMVVVAAFLASSVAFGVIYSLGVFLKPMGADFGASAASVSALFSITSAIYYGLGAPAGRIADRCGPRAVVAAGAMILGAGLCLTAIVGDIRLAYLTYGIGVGAGGACCYVPTLAAVGGWFDRRRNTALGVAAAGTGAGTLAVPPIAAALIAHYGWRASYLALGLAGTAILLLCALMIQAPPAPRAQAKAGPGLGTLLRSPAFLMLYFTWMLGTMALFVPFVFLPAFARDHGAGEVAAAALVSIIGGTSIVGRLVLGPVGDRVGVVVLFKASVLAMGLSYAIWLLTGYGWLMLFAVVLGTAYGVRIAAVPVVLIEFFGVEKLGSTLGIFFTATGVAALLGPSLAGLAVELSGGYRGGILFALAVGLLGFAVIAPLRRGAG
ncbi:MAG TPA: MFS transporter [Stellaceae bacterium]|nr:MFS transporter [Stellaceae bacterium]